MADPTLEFLDLHFPRCGGSPVLWAPPSGSESSIHRCRRRSELRRLVAVRVNLVCEGPASWQAVSPQTAVLSAHVHAPRSFSVQTAPGLHTCCRGPAWLRSEDSGRSPHGSGRVPVGRGCRAGSCPFHPRAPSSGLGRALLGAQDTGGPAPAGGRLTQRPGFLPASSACGAPRGHSDAQHGDDQACRQRDRHRDTHASAPLPAGRGRWHLLCSFGVPVLLPGPRPSEPAAPGSREPRSPQPRPPPRGPGSQGETASQRL